MTARLLGRKSSTNVQKVMWAAAELGVAYAQEEMGGKFGGLNTVEFGAMNPVRKVPVWIEGDFVLAESHAILRYLSASHDGALMPSDAQAAAVADQWMEIANTTFFPAMFAVFMAVYRTPPDKQDAATIAKAVEGLGTVTAMYEDRLASSAWLSGDAFGLADIATGVWMHRYWTLPFDRHERPALARWTGQMRERAAFREIVETSYEELRGW